MDPFPIIDGDIYNNGSCMRGKLIECAINWSEMVLTSQKFDDILTTSQSIKDLYFHILTMFKLILCSNAYVFPPDNAAIITKLYIHFYSLISNPPSKQSQ